MALNIIIYLKFEVKLEAAELTIKAEGPLDCSQEGSYTMICQFWGLDQIGQ